jgi:hypothetical protein
MVTSCTITFLGQSTCVSHTAPQQVRHSWQCIAPSTQHRPHCASVGATLSNISKCTCQQAELKAAPTLAASASCPRMVWQ